MSSPDAMECSAYDETHVAASELSLHGLWPNYDDDGEQRTGQMYPQFCDVWARCFFDMFRWSSSCAVSDQVLNKYSDDFDQYAPGYAREDNAAAHHEFQKHGTCMPIDADAFFEESFRAHRRMPTPAVIRTNVGKTVSLSALQEAYGGADSVGISCTSEGDLDQVFTCYAPSFDKSRLDFRVNCPRNLLKSAYTNGCHVNGHGTVRIPLATKQCDEHHLRQNFVCETMPPKPTRTRQRMIY
ncbi:MAG: hypothetical protein MHM6MM_000366 [Cercozoa sp. M6MM]